MKISQITEKKRLRQSRVLAIMAVVLWMVFNLVFTYVANNLGWYISAAEPAYYTLSGVTDAYFEKINPEGKRVVLTFCMSEDKLKESPTYGRVLDTVEQFAARYDFFSYRHLNVTLDYKELEVYAEKHDVTISDSTVIVSSPDTGESIVRALSTFYVYDEESEDESMVYNGEEIVATMVSRVMKTERPIALFTTGHGETPTVSLMNQLYSAGYDVTTADISLQSIEEKCSLIVIASPLYDFEEYADKSLVSEISRLRDFMLDGGNILVLRAPENGALPRLDAFLASFGLVTAGEAYLTDTSAAIDIDGSALLLSYAEGRAEGILSTVKDTTSAPMVFADCGKITLQEGEGYEAYPLLFTSSSAAEYLGGERISQADDTGYAVAAVSECAAKNGGTGKLMLINAANAADKILLETDGYANETLFYAFAEYGSGLVTPKGCGVILINTYPLEGMNRQVANIWLAILAVGCPLAVSVAGTVVVLRRKAGKAR